MMIDFKMLEVAYLSLVFAMTFIDAVKIDRQFTRLSGEYVDGAVEDFTAVSHIECCAKCTGVDQCIATNFNTVTNACELLSALTTGIETFSRSDWTFYHLSEFIFITDLPVLEQGSCDTGWIHYNGNCYFHNTNELRLYDAYTACQSLDANLVHMDDEAEDTFVYLSIVNVFMPRVFWIAMQDVAHFYFTWNTGDPVVYTNWAPGYPTRAVINYDCCIYYPSGWINTYCHYLYPSVCKKPMLM